MYYHFWDTLKILAYAKQETQKSDSGSRLNDPDVIEDSLDRAWMVATDDRDTSVNGYAYAMD